MTEGFQVPLVAWTLGVHTLDVEASPAAGAPPPAAPNVILQTRAQSNSTPLPIVHTWPQRPLSLRRARADVPAVHQLPRGNLRYAMTSRER